LKFTSTKVQKTDTDTFTLLGDLTLKGITKPVKLHVEFNGTVKDPWGHERAGFIITGKINRSEWGVNFNAALETGGVVLGDEVRIIAEIELVKETASVAA